MARATILSFKDLMVWQKAMKLAGRIYAASQSFPADERFGLVAEIRKTARSIPANIAEGKMRLSPKDFRHFISIALGSAGELHTQILLAGQEGYLSDSRTSELEEYVEEVGRMLRGLERALA